MCLGPQKAQEKGWGREKIVAHHIHFIDPYYFVSEQGIGPAEREKEMGFSHSCTSDPLDWSQVAQLLHNPIPVVGCMVRTLLR